jgi:hypothetical protein
VVEFQNVLTNIVRCVFYGFLLNVFACYFSSARQKSNQRKAPVLRALRVRLRVGARGRTRRNSPAWQQAQTVAASISAVSPMLSLVKKGGERHGAIKADNALKFIAAN